MSPSGKSDAVPGIDTPRRKLLKRVGGAAAVGLTAGLAGCSGDGNGEDGADTEVYAVSFHWGFKMISPDGTVMDSIDASEGDSIRIHGVNLEPLAEGEEIDVPEAIASTAQDNYESWEAESVERIAPELGISEADLEADLKTAEDEYPDHSLAVTDPNGNQVFNVELPADMSSPVEKTLSVDSTGGYQYSCETYCGVGHPYMTLEDAIEVS